MSVQTAPSRAGLLDSKDKQRLEDVGFMTCMTLTLLGNYAQTGHFGGPLAYTPYNVAVHLAGPEARRPAARLPAPEASLRRQVHARRRPLRADVLRAVDDHGRGALPEVQGDRRQEVLRGAEGRLPRDRRARIPPRRRRARRRCCRIRGSPTIRCSRRRRRAAAASTRCRATSNRSTRATTSTAALRASGLALAAGKAAFWDMVGAPVGQPKVIAFEGEFALCAGHAQELKTQALALKVGKRLRVMFSENNAGIDDSLMGGVIDSKYTGYDFVEQWKSYGWNVMTMAERTRLRPDRRRAQGDGRRRSGRSPADHRHRQDDQGLLADGVERQDRRRRPIRWSGIRAIRTR